MREFTAINVINNGTGVTLSGINTTDTPLNAVVILVMRDGNGRFLNAFIQNVSFGNQRLITNHEVVWSGGTPVRHSNTVYVEAFLWDSLMTMIPILRTE